MTRNIYIDLATVRALFSLPSLLALVTWFEVPCLLGFFIYVLLFWPLPPFFFTKMFIGELLFAIPSQRVFLVFECGSLVNQCSCVGVWACNQQMLILPGGAFGG